MPLTTTYGDMNTITALSQGSWNEKNFAEQAISTVGAAAIDMGVSMWNSVANIATFGEYEDVSTRLLLQDMGADGALDAYDNNKEAVELLSFVGGVFIPGMAAVKISRGIRAGLKGTNFLSPVRHKEDLLKFETMVKDAQTATAEYTSLKRTMFMRGQAENLMDNVAAEVAILGTFNAHPYMEDYLADPVSNFGISMAIGGVLGGGISALITRSELATVGGKVETAVLGTVAEKAQLYNVPFADTASSIIHMDLAAKNLDNLAALPATTGLEKEMAVSVARSLRDRIKESVKANTGQDIQGIKDEAVRSQILAKFQDSRVLGAERMDFLTYKAPKVQTSSPFARIKNAIFKTEEIDLGTGDATETFIKQAYFNPELNTFVTGKDAMRMANAADRTDMKGIIALSKKHAVRQQTSSWKDTILSGDGGAAEIDYGAKLHFYDQQSTPDLLKAEILADDLAAINGYVGTMRQRLAEAQGRLQELNVEDFGDDLAGYAKANAELNQEISDLTNAKVKLYSGDRVQLVNLEEVSQLPTGKTDPASYIKETYFEDVGNSIDIGEIRPLVRDDWAKHDQFGTASQLSHDFYDFVRKMEPKAHAGKGLINSIAPNRLDELTKEFVKLPNIKAALADMTDADAGLSDSTKLLLARWIGGDYADKELFRNAMTSARTMRRGMDSTTTYHDELQEILRSPVTKQAQDAMRKHADAQGNMYLYRGTKGEIHGDTAVSSYTHAPQVARSFSGKDTIGMYKVNVEDVVGYLYKSEREWLVGTGKRDITDVKWSETGASHVKKVFGDSPKPTSGAVGGFNKAPTFETLNLKQAEDRLAVTQTTEYIKAIEAGTPKEVAAMQYNIPNELTDILSNQNTAMDYLSAQMNNGKGVIGKWATPNQVPDMLSPTRKQLVFSAVPNKHMQVMGQIADKHRKAILGQTELKATEKALLNEAADTEGAARVAAKINLLDEQFATISKEWLEASVLSSRSELARSVYNAVLNSKDVQILREGLKEFVNGKGGNPLYSSADFVTSRMGYVGKLITQLGDRRVEVTNKVFEKLSVPITTQLKKLTTNEVARTEFAIFDNIRQSSGEFLRYDADLRTFVTKPKGATFDRNANAFVTVEKDAAGNAVKRVVAGEPATELSVVDDAVHMAMLRLQDAGDEIYHMQVTNNRISGKAAPNDIGFWMPSNSVVNKHLGYVLNLDTHEIKMLVGNTEEELKGLKHAYAADKKTNEVFRTRQELASDRLQGFDQDLERITAADMAKQKKGIGLIVPDTDPQRLSDIIEGIRNRLSSQASQMLEDGMYDLTSKLDMVSKYNRNALDNQGKQGYLSGVKQLANKDTSKDIKAILLGHSQIGGQEAMGYVNKAASVGIHYGIQATAKAWALVAPVVPGGGIDYKKYTEALAAQNIQNPYAVFDEVARPLMYERAKLSIGNLNPDRVVNAANAMAATMALKFGDLAQPLVNMLSLPILMTSTISRSIKAAEIETAGQVFAGNPAAVMISGIRRMNSSSVDNVRLRALATEEGLLDVMISEVDDVIKQATFATGGAIGKIEKALDSNFVTMMSKPSEWAEKQVRHAAFFTGVETAYRVYGPNISDAQVMVFSRDFMKQAIGNYSTAQRPMMFQGTAGAAMGLFQTYMLTYAQNMYRHLDLKDYKGLGQTMLAQGGIFGAGSLPGFNQISTVIGEHFSDDHYDITTKLYRALPSELANVLVYGLPSNLAPALHTRGDVNPRIPTGVSTMVAPSMIAQMAESFIGVGKAVMDQDRNAGQAFFEALSMQSVSRPIARLSELATGYSVTRAGNQIAGPEEVWSWQGILARAFSTRTLAESKTREAMYKDDYYKSVNSENRQAVLETLRSNIRGDTATPELMDKLALEYMRTGSPQGFRQAANQAFMEHSQDKIIDLDSKLGNSPLMFMLDDIE